MKNSIKLTLAASAVALLAACGGGGGGSENLTIPSANTAPVANAGQIQNILVAAKVTLNGSNSSDANSDALTYSWTLTSKPAGSTAALSTTTSAMPTFTADIAGAYVASLVVNDGKENSTVSTVTVNATVANAAPVANAGTAQNVTTRSTVTLNGSNSSDANGDALTYSWTLTSKPTGSTAVLSSATSAMPIFTADVAGAYVASLVVNDGQVSSTAATVTVNATVANAAPVANAGTAQNVTAQSTVTLNGSNSSDVNGDTLTYSWTLTSKPAFSTAVLSNTRSATPTFTADVAGTYVASLVVNDGKVSSTAATVSVNATAQSTLVSIQISPENSSAQYGSKIQYKLFGTYSNGSRSEITSGVSWKTLTASCPVEQLNSYRQLASPSIFGTTIQQYTTARAQLNTMIESARIGDSTALATLVSLSSKYLALSRTLFASSQAYTNDVQFILQALTPQNAFVLYQPINQVAQSCAIGNWNAYVYYVSLETLIPGRKYDAAKAELDRLTNLASKGNFEAFWRWNGVANSFIDAGAIGINLGTNSSYVSQAAASINSFVWPPKAVDINPTTGLASVVMINNAMIEATFNGLTARTFVLVSAQ